MPAMGFRLAEVPGAGMGIALEMVVGEQYHANLKDACTAKLTHLFLAAVVRIFFLKSPVLIGPRTAGSPTFLSYLTIQPPVKVASHVPPAWGFPGGAVGWIDERCACKTAQCVALCHRDNKPLASSNHRQTK